MKHNESLFLVLNFIKKLITHKFCDLVKIKIGLENTDQLCKSLQRLITHDFSKGSDHLKMSVKIFDQFCRWSEIPIKYSVNFLW